MGLTHPFSRHIFAILTVAAVVTSTVVLAQPASADTAPQDSTVEKTVTSDALPTVQIDGVVWDQVVVGKTVYAGGDFKTARPAGAAVGVNTVPRTNLLAYNIETGALVTSFNHDINGEVNAVAESPDGTRLYIGGAFTKVDGVTRNRIAAFNTATGALITSFTPSANTTVNAIAATNSTVYVGGNFTAIGSATRVRVAALSASNGAVMPFTAVADGGRVRAIVISPDASKIVLGGNFTTINSSDNPGYGLGAVDAVTGAIRPWNVNSHIRNAGDNSSIYSLDSDGDSVYGSAYDYHGVGTLEGAFRADWTNGDLVWVEDCHGDTYSVSAATDVIYTASHAHYCGNSGGHPQTEPDWTMQRAMAWSKSLSGGVNRPDIYGYEDSAGIPTPKLLNWYPDINVGTYTGVSQGAWDVTADGKYVLYGGEFTRVNNKLQQGLTRFATSDIAPNDDGPRLGSSSFVPSVSSLAAGTVRVAWLANYDRDNEFLKYDVIRNGANSAPVHTVVGGSRIWFDRPTMGYLDTGLTPGQTYSYRLRATDPFGNVAYGDPVSVTVASTGSVSDYAKSVLSDGATSYWRMGESSGTLVNDWAGISPANAGSGVTRNAPGVISGDPDSAATFSGTSTGLVASSKISQADDSFAVEAWFKTTSTGGGKIVGFGSKSSGDSSNYDRHIYMDGSGRVIFGVYPSAMRTVQSSTGFNDGKWHQVVANLGSTGMQLYLDGRRVAQRADTTWGQAYTGFWRIGGDTTWTGNKYFTGSIDEVSVYNDPLTIQQVNNHLALSGRDSTLVTAPSDSYGAAVFGDSPDLYWRLGESSGSTAADTTGNGNTGLYSGNVTKGVSGAVAGTTNTAASFDGTNGAVASTKRFSNPQVYSLETWFQSTSNRGGKLIGFSGTQTGASSSNYDRHVYLQDDGRLVFGTYTGRTNTITTDASYNDGAWHQVVATQSSAGLKLYVDGQLQGTNPVTSAQVYDGYWRVGGDTTWGSTSAYLDAKIDEAAVYGTALSAATVQSHYTAGSGSTPNAAPKASFTSTPANLDLAVDASASTDSDGRVASYLWNFGDGTSATGVTATHTYAAAGTYTVTLTVTDDDGATNKLSRSITATAPPADNVAPVAAFTATTSDLMASVNGGTSSDSDGTVASWAWAFGDGGTANGATASHAYAAAGTYTVTLTVTDNGGAAGTTTKSVTVTNPAVPSTALAADSFGRTTANGLGSAQTGGAWSTSGASSNFSVDGSTARLRSTAGGTILNAYLPAVSSDDTDLQVTTSLEQASSGAGTYVSVIGRRVGSADYRARAVIYASGSVNLQTQVNGSTLKAVKVSGLTYAAGDQLQVRLQVFGTSPTTVRAKTWKTGTAEPTAWQVSSTDSTAGLQTAGHIGVGSYISASSNVLPLYTTFDNLWAGSTTAGGPAAPPANAAPVATFTSSAANLVASVDGSGSGDSDGTIAGYAWTFGDGGTANRATASHTYAAAGTYTVKLTVTDNDGAINSATKSISVVAPQPGNAAPVAAFTSSAANLVASVDGSGSGDSDGTIAGYAWTFGDGGTANRATASHTYAAAGTYTVKLTVTDNDGAASSKTGTVTVSAAPGPVTNDLATDTFTRTATGNWSTADAGGAWSTGSTSNKYAVTGGVGSMTAAAGGSISEAFLNDVSSSSTQVEVTASLRQATSGGGAFVSVMGRRVGTQDYRARIVVNAEGAVNLQLQRNGATLKAVRISNLAYTAGDELRVRLQVTGTAPTTIQASVWKLGAAEPTTWQLSTTDSTAALQAPGGIGLGLYLSGSSTIVPLAVEFDDLRVTVPE